MTTTDTNIPCTDQWEDDDFDKEEQEEMRKLKKELAKNFMIIMFAFSILTAVLSSVLTLWAFIRFISYMYN